MTEAGKRWTITVEQDPASEDLILPLPPDLLAEVGWQAGDALTWHDRGDGTWELRLKQELLDSEGC